jgi:hypothetical protein
MLTQRNVNDKIEIIKFETKKLQLLLISRHEQSITY